MMGYVTAIVVTVCILSSSACIVYINEILRKNAQAAFDDLTDKLALNLSMLISEAEQVGRSMSRNTMLINAMKKTTGQYTKTEQYDDYFQLKALISHNLDPRLISNLQLVFYHEAFYTRDNVNLLSIRSERARELGFSEDAAQSDDSRWTKYGGTLRYLQPVLDYNYSSKPIGQIILELPEESISAVFSHIQSLENARFTLKLNGETMRVDQTGDESMSVTLSRSISISPFWQLDIEASSVQQNVRLSEALLAIAPWILGGCALILLVFSRYAKHFYHEIASLADDISNLDLMRGGLIGDRRYQEFSAIATHFNALLKEIRRLFLDEIEAQEKERVLQLRMLESQINPHFLYNSLDVINWLAYQQGAEDVAALARRLGAFYRDSLSRETTSHSLADELAHVDTYLKIMKCRVEEEITVTMDIGEQYKNARLPRLSLQPIVENALQHGILQKPTQSGCIDLRARLLNGRLMISVSDDGPGMTHEQLTRQSSLSIWPPTDMHGLTNIHHRALLLYGEGYGISIASELGTSTTVTLTVPFNDKY